MTIEINKSLFPFIACAIRAEPAVAAEWTD